MDKMKQKFNGFSFRYKTTSIPRSKQSDRIVNRIRVKLNGIEYSSISDLVEKNPDLKLTKSSISNLLAGKIVKKYEHLKLEKC